MSAWYRKHCAAILHGVLFLILVAYLASPAGSGGGKIGVWLPDAIVTAAAARSPTRSCSSPPIRSSIATGAAVTVAARKCSRMCACFRIGPGGSGTTWEAIMRRKPTDEECAFLTAVTQCFKPEKDGMSPAEGAQRLRMSFRSQFIRSWWNGLWAGLGTGSLIGWILAGML